MALKSMNKMLNFTKRNRNKSHHEIPILTIRLGKKKNPKQFTKSLLRLWADRYTDTAGGKAKCYNLY